MEIGKYRDREDDNDDYICRAEDLPGMLAVQLQNPRRPNCAMSSGHVLR